MGYIKLSMNGNGEIEKQLQYIAELPEIAEKALMEGAQVLLPAVRAKAPAQPGGGTHIRNRLEIRLRGTKRNPAVDVGVWYGYTPVAERNDNWKDKDPPVAYYVEYGHGGPHPAPAHPYMAPRNTPDLGYKGGPPLARASLPCCLEANLNWSRARKSGEKPLQFWITEYGWFTNAKGVSEELQAAYLARALLICRRHGLDTGLFFYDFMLGKTTN